MKKSQEIRYPHSANLFQFCRKVLDHKFGGIRVIDQDVGQILGFDPADCSHWKKGKKNIRSIQAMKSIANHLGVDEKLVVDVASGEMDDWEAYFEYHGYGFYDIDNKVVEEAKKDFYRKNAGSWTKDKEQEFKSFFEIDRHKIKQIVQAIHDKINFQEAPLYVPEVIAAYPEIKLIPMDEKELQEKYNDIVVTKKGKNSFEILYPQGREVRPYVRFRLAKALGEYFLSKEGLIKLDENPDDFARHVVDVQTNIFAANLLCPARLVKNEMKNIDVSKDIISQLADTFWVSKYFMNTRLKDILSHQD